MNNYRTWLYLAAAWILIILLFPFISFSAGPLPTTNVTLAWDPVTNATGYNLLVGTNAASYTRTNSVGPTNRATITNLIVNARYYFTAQTVAASGLTSSNAAEISAIAGDTNIYVSETNVLYQRDWNWQSVSSLSPRAGWTNTGSWFRTMDELGVIGGPPQLFLRAVDATNTPFATNIVTLTNPSPNQLMSIPKPPMPS